MGICISSVSSFDEEAQNGDKNLAFSDEKLYNDSVPGLASLFSLQGNKGPNQDSAILCQGFGEQDGLFCGVFDGHGRNGRIVSRLVRDRLPALILNQLNALGLVSPREYKEAKGLGNEELGLSKKFDQWKEACNSSFKVMDKELSLLAQLDCSCSGTTAVVLIKQGEDVVIANLGDSRAVLGTVSEDGDMVALQLTTDLKPGLPQEAERIKMCKGRVFALESEPNTQRVWLPSEDTPGLAVARAFGDFTMKSYGIISNPELTFPRLTNQDKFLIVASDGVWDVLSNEEVVSIVGCVERAEDAARAVVEEASRSWKRKFPTASMDDCSAVCLFMT